MDIKNVLNKIEIDLDSIQDKKLGGIIKDLMNVIEYLFTENQILTQKNQELKDENSRLKGEKGKPKIRPQTPDKKNNDHSSEKERQGTESKSNKNTKKPKTTEIKVDRIERCLLNREILPVDAIFKGYESTVIQDVKIITENIKFEREVFYSPSTKKTYLAQLPKGYQGQFGPAVKSLILSMYQDSGVTEPALKRFLETHGLFISSGTISRIITDTIEPFHQEKLEIVNAGLNSTNYQHLDDTASRVNGINHHTHILCNPFFTAYFTLPTRDRLAAIEVLSNGKLQFIINTDTCALLKEWGLPKKPLEKLEFLSKQSQIMTRQEIDAVIQSIFPQNESNKNSKKKIRDAAAIIAYHEYCNTTQILMTDGAYQFERITMYHILCWIHEGRHYKKLTPINKLHQQILEAYINDFWIYYRRLLCYKEAPHKKIATKLSTDFDKLFSRKTGYKLLDDRIARTLIDKDKLLLVLKFPYLPLHNNLAEGGARIQARKRDISLQTKNAKGTKAKDTIMTIVETGKKLGVNTFKYIYDRLSKKFEMISLADLIHQQATP